MHSNSTPKVTAYFRGIKSIFEPELFSTARGFIEIRHFAKKWGKNVKHGLSNGRNNLPPTYRWSPPYAIFQHPENKEIWRCAVKTVMKTLMALLMIWWCWYVSTVLAAGISRHTESTPLPILRWWLRLILPVASPKRIAFQTKVVPIVQQIFNILDGEI